MSMPGVIAVISGEPMIARMGSCPITLDKIIAGLPEV